MSSRTIIDCDALFDRGLKKKSRKRLIFNKFTAAKKKAASLLEEKLKKVPQNPKIYSREDMICRLF